MFYTANNAKLKIDGNEIIALNASISLSASVQPRYDYDQRNTHTFIPDNGIGGTLSFSYYLTGADYFKQFISGQGEPQGSLAQQDRNEFGDPISGNFGGLNFQSGYLTSYSVNFSPNSPVVANATVSFFDDMSNTTGNSWGHSDFEPTEARVPHIDTVLNCRNASVVPGNDSWHPAEQLQNIDNFIAGTYNYSIEVNPVYLMGETKPSSVSYGVQSVNMNFELDNPTGFLPYSGADAMVAVQLRSRTDDSNAAETFTCSGIINQRSLASAPNQYIKHTINITENDVSEFVIEIPAIYDNAGGSVGIGSS